MVILKSSNQSDIEVVQITPETYILNVKGEDCGTYTLPELAVKAIELIDKNGIIIAKNIHGQTLEEKIKSLLAP